MSSTHEDAEARFRKMMLNQSPGERVAMACRMFSTGRTLLRAGLPEPSLEDTLNQHQRIFLRLYGADFSPSEREKILKTLEIG
jgi:hypothetical protein